jgi:hypothetical protein
MDTMISRFFLHNWPRKIVAIVSALIIWLFVNGSITETKTIPNIPIRIVNLPPDKTIVGLLPNRLLSKRITLTLSGSKDVINDLEPGDLEVLLDVSTADSDEWVVHITKKNLISLNPSLDLLHSITAVSHPEFVLKLSRMVNAKIPIRVLPPIGEAPAGYEFLDIWPQKLTQTVSGPQEEIQALKTKGLELILNLNDVTKNDLDALKPAHSTNHDDEISFIVPDKWKKVAVPFHNNALEDINDPEAQDLRIDFLRKTVIPIGKELPIRVFYPVKFSDTINQATHPLETNEFISKKNDLTLFTMPLYVSDVSRLFLDIVIENLEIAIVAAPKSEREQLPWSIDVIDPHELEDMYVAFLLSNSPKTVGSQKRREVALRKRFRDYMQRLVLYSAPDQQLHLDSTLGSNSVRVTVVK